MSSTGLKRAERLARIRAPRVGARHDDEVTDLRPLAGAPEGDHPSRPWPRAQLVVPRTEIARPAHPMIDVHNHLGRWLSADGTFLGGEPEDLTRVLDRLHIDTVVNLDGRWGDELDANVARYDAVLGDRVLTFCHVDWELLALGDAASPECHAMLEALMVDSASRGARGVKVWKDLGLTVRDATGALVPPDDPRVVTALRVAGDLGLPVLIHTADPVAFFEPLDETNERYDELSAFPDWWFGGPGLPTFSELIDAMHRLVAQCPGTTFIGAHVGGHAEDLGAVGAALTALPNFHVDTAGRLGEVGRQPRAFRALVEAFPDRVLWGSDCFPIDDEAIALWWRFLETPDEHFDYAGEDEAPGQGNWRISGADLPPGLLPGLYHDNAARLLDL